MFFMFSKSTSRQSGNVLFLILIAVALFAALTYAVTQSTRSGSGSTSNAEKAQMLASQFTQYGAALNSAIMRLQLSGCTDLTLNFATPALAHPTLWGGSTNPNAPVNGSCDVFGPQGTTYIANLPAFGSRMNITSLVGVDAVGTAVSEIILYYVIGDTQLAIDVCSAFNRSMGNTGSASGGTANVSDWTWAKGVFNASPAASSMIGEDGGPALQGGKHAGCLDGGTSHGGGNRILYQVLLPR